MANDYELLEKLHSLAQEAQGALIGLPIGDGEWTNSIFLEMFEIIEQLREKHPQAPWNRN